MVIHIDPYALSEPFLLRWYEVTLFVSLTVSLLLLWRLAGKYGLEPSRALSLALVALPGGLIGARLLHVIDSYSYYAANPALALRVWDGGFAQYGMMLGWLGCALALNALWMRLPAHRFLDLAPVPLLVGFAVGRIGCLLHGCCFGSPTNLPWGVTFTHPDSIINRVAPELEGVAVHPVPAYEMLLFAVLAVAVLYLRPRLPSVPYASFMLFLLGHSLIRFGTAFLRHDYLDLQRVGWLTQAQVIAVCLFIVALIWLIHHHLRGNATVDHHGASGGD